MLSIFSCALWPSVYLLSVQFSSVTQLCLTLCTSMGCSILGSPVCHQLLEWSLPKLMFIESVMPSNHLILSCPLLLLPSIFPSRVFSSESALHIRWPEYWSFSFSISPSSEYSQFVSFKVDWFDLLDVQETLKSLLKPVMSKE